MTREEIFELARKCGAPDWWTGATDSNVPGGKWLTYFFHAAQALEREKLHDANMHIKQLERGFDKVIRQEQLA